METPVPAFKSAFQVEIAGVSEHGDSEVFYSIDGLGKSVASSNMMFSPGGTGTCVHDYRSIKTKDLVMRRPIVNKPSKITKWCENGLNKLTHTPVQIHIFILDAEKNVVAQWTVENAYPVGIEISSLSLSNYNSVIEEKLTFRYLNIVRNKPI
jgi:phage tail-like protein